MVLVFAEPCIQMDDRKYAAFDCNGLRSFIFARDGAVASQVFSDVSDVFEML